MAINCLIVCRYQDHLIPRSQLAYRTLHLAISMAIDLRLDQDFDDTSRSQHKVKPAFGPSSSAETTGKEWHRASLGCHYLSSVYVALLMLQKP